MRGAVNEPVMPPSNVPAPPTSTASLGCFAAVRIAASSRSLACQSWLVTWNGKSAAPL